MDSLDYIKIVNTYANTIYRVALSYCKNKYDAEDIVQNVFLKLLQSDMTFHDGDHIKKWLMRVTVNNAKDYCTSYWKRKIVSLNDSDSYQQHSFPSQRNSDLYDAVMELSSKYRIVTYLYYYEEYSIKEIAEILNIKETTVQTRLMRARKKLKMKLEEVWQDE